MTKKELWFHLPLRPFSWEVDRLFDELIHRRWGVGTTMEQWDPQLDLYETDSAFILEADLPGVKKQDVSVELENGDLVLRGRRMVEHVRRGSNFYRRERRSGQFLRRVSLPASVDREQIRAEFRNGVLRVTLPKMQRERGERA
jgi:HSP20 family protein